MAAIYGDDVKNKMPSDYESRVTKKMHKVLRVVRTIIIRSESHCLKNCWHLEDGMYVQQLGQDQHWHGKNLTFPTCSSHCPQDPGCSWAKHPGCKQGDYVPHQSYSPQIYDSKLSNQCRIGTKTTDLKRKHCSQKLFAKSVLIEWDEKKMVIRKS